jgi:hypothetical protein
LVIEIRILRDLRLGGIVQAAQGSYQGTALAVP